jgi:hypothetical protein
MFGAERFPQRQPHEKRKRPDDRDDETIVRYGKPAPGILHGGA